MSLTPLLIMSGEQNRTSCHTIERSGISSAHDQTDVFDDGYLRVDLRNRAVTLSGRNLSLTSTELQCVLHLASRQGQVVPYQELLIHVWGPAYADEILLLQVYMRNLRYKVERDPYHPVYILEHQHEGYYFGAPATPISSSTRRVEEQAASLR